MLLSIGYQRVGHDLGTEEQQRGMKRDEKDYLDFTMLKGKESLLAHFLANALHLPHSLERGSVLDSILRQGHYIIHWNHSHHPFNISKFRSCEQEPKHPIL